jgi:hypothetical protein
MAKAGWCDVCESNVWLTEDGNCPEGHDGSHVSGVYEAERDPLKDAADSLEDAANTTAEAVGKAWDEAAPAAKEAADAAADAAQKAADAAASFGKKLLSGGDRGEEEAPEGD